MMGFEPSPFASRVSTQRLQAVAKRLAAAVIFLCAGTDLAASRGGAESRVGLAIRGRQSVHADPSLEKSA